VSAILLIALPFDPFYILLSERPAGISSPMRADVARQPIVASRMLMLDGQTSLTITIRQPYKSGDDYACECEIVGLADVGVRTVMGVDSLQALLIAVVALQKQLEPYLNRLSWVTSDEGDIGLPHVMVFRNPLNDRLCQVLDAVLLRHEACWFRSLCRVAAHFATPPQAGVLARIWRVESRVHNAFDRSRLILTLRYT
jgi:hypothetical protein